MSNISNLTIVNDITKISPGQAISCEYTSTIGVFGSFNNLGKATKNELIKVGDLSNPDGTFYFICVGYNTKGELKLVADRNIQTNISWETLNSVGLCSNDTLNVNISQSYSNLSLRLLNSAYINDSTLQGEYDQCLLNNTLNGLISINDDIWNMNIASWCLQTPIYYDVEDNAPNSDFRIVRGGSVSNDYLLNVSSKSSSSLIGFRPVLIVKNKKYTRGNPGCKLQIVSDLKNIQPGQAISCEYTSSSNVFGSFNNLGKAIKNTLSDIPIENPDGTFYFICVGYNNDGYKKLVADRNIQSNISWESLNSAGLCSNYGLETKISGYDVRIRLPITTSDRHLDSKSQDASEWDYIISNSNLNNLITPSDNLIWNAASSLSHTIASLVTVDDNGTFSNQSTRIVRGIQDSNYSGISQGKVLSNTIDDLIGFRPILLAKSDSSVDLTYPENKLNLANIPIRSLPGQAISCEYTALSGKAGNFANLGCASKDVISDVAPESPDGTFYFIHVGYTPNGSNKYVADRNIQTNISWNTLSEAGYCTTSGCNASNLTNIEDSYIRLISSSKCNKNIMTSISEWDSIIMNITNKLGNTNIQLDGLFNYTKSRSLTLDSPMMNDDVGTSNDAGTIVARGYEASDYSTVQKDIFKMSDSFSNLGFRPVLVIPTDKQSIIATNIVTPTNINNQDVNIKSTFTLLLSDKLSENSIVIFKINDVEIKRKSLTETTINEDISFDLFKNGDNKLLMIISVDGVDNKYEFIITKEYDADNERFRQLYIYSGGFNIDNMNVVNGNVVNNNIYKIKLDESDYSKNNLLIEKNTISISVE